MFSQHKNQSPKGQLLNETVRKNKFYTVGLVLLVIAVPLLTISDINKMEAGTIASERVIFPIGTIYNQWGYRRFVSFNVYAGFCNLCYRTVYSTG